MHDVLSVHDNTVNLQGTVFMLQIQSDLETAALFSGPILCGHEKLTSVT